MAPMEQENRRGKGAGRESPTHCWSHISVACSVSGVVSDAAASAASKPSWRFERASAPSPEAAHERDSDRHQHRHHLHMRGRRMHMLMFVGSHAHGVYRDV
eukprot:4719589-Pleurochrysis_carterae.AAC.3